MGRDMHNVSDDEFDFDDEYFARTYQPLSNLPTPPLSSSNSSTPQSPRITADDGHALEASFLGKVPRKIWIQSHCSNRALLAGSAIHLANMLPPNASLATPSVPTVQAILTRAELPMETIALAVCILDSLEEKKFSRKWRLACPLAKPTVTPSQSKRHTLPASPLFVKEQLHIDSVLPEIMILTALMIAAKFTEDLQQPTQYYSAIWGRDQWTLAQINFTERCIMEALDYRIVPLMDAECIEFAMDDMQRAEKYAMKQQPNVTTTTTTSSHSRSMSTGIAVPGLGLQFTPQLTPIEGGQTPGAECAGFGDETRAAFRQPVLSPDFLQLPGQN